MSGTISAARVLLMAALLGMAVLVVSCRGNSKPSQAQLLIQSPPSAQELPLDGARDLPTAARGTWLVVASSASGAAVGTRQAEECFHPPASALIRSPFR